MEGAVLTLGPDVHLRIPNDTFDCCARCGFSGGDVRIIGCACIFHTRCLSLPEQPLSFCPLCKSPAGGIVLIPMCFRELDEAKKTSLAMATLSQTSMRKKRKQPGESSGLDEKLSLDDADQRTGRWTKAETAYVDEMIAKFEAGVIPVGDGMKLNDFLAAMLQCKQSRLTKKMKNAKLSSRSFKRTTGFIQDLNDAREFSSVEEAFFYSIHGVEERAEMRFQMQKHWREMFCVYCAGVGQPLDTTDFDSSVEEIKRRADLVREAARMKRREMMIALALKTDKQNPNSGAIIEVSDENHEALANELNTDYTAYTNDDNWIFNDANEKKSSSPYLDEIMKYIERNNVPFEHVDAWVPSFIPPSNMEWAASGNPSCRLCFAGCITMDIASQKRRSLMTPEEHFNLLTFGEYSQKFSFDIGCGLPGRVYQSGIATWEQSVQNAPLEHFERCGGAIQCGVKTVVGIPIPSPNVGRIVVVLYSCHDRQKDQGLVGRLSEEFSRLLPSPRWQLVVDVGISNEVAETKAADSSSKTAPHSKVSSTSIAKDPRLDAVVNLLGEHMPSEPSSPMAAYLPGFMSLRLLILRPSRSEHEEELLQTMLDSYESYATAGRSPHDMALLLARDCMFLTQQQPYSVTSVSQKANLNGTSLNFKSFAAPSQQAPSSVSNTNNHLVWNHNFSQIAPIQAVMRPQSNSLPQQQYLSGMQFVESVTQGNIVGETNGEICQNSVSQHFSSTNPGGSDT